MKLSAKTISLLKNFSAINPSIVIKPGSTLATMSTTKSIVAKAEVPDNFPNQVAIYNLGRFISSYSLLDDPDLEFGDNSITMKDSTKKVVYHCSDASLIIVPPEKEIKMPSVDVQCRVSNKDLQTVIKALGVLALPELAFVGDGENVMLQATNSKEQSTDTYSINVGATDKTFRAIFKPENIKVIDGDYEIRISSKGISQFVGTEVTYWIAVEQSSTFEG